MISEKGNVSPTTTYHLYAPKLSNTSIYEVDSYPFQLLSPSCRSLMNHCSNDTDGWHHSYYSDDDDGAYCYYRPNDGDDVDESDDDGSGLRMSFHRHRHPYCHYYSLQENSHY